MAGPLTPATDPLALPPEPDISTVSPAGATSAEVVRGLRGTTEEAAKIKSQLKDLRSTGMAALAQEYKAQDAARSEMETKRLAILGEKPISPEGVKAPEYQQSDPLKLWSSPAMMVAMFGSMLTRTPMTSAMNAAASAINAFKKNDLDNYNIQYKKWQAETANAEKMFNHQVGLWEHELADTERHEGETDGKYAKRIAGVERQMAIMATTLNDERMALMVKQGGYKAVEQAIAVEKAWFAKMETAQKQIVEGHVDRVGQMEVYNNPDFQKLAADAKDPNLTAEQRQEAGSKALQMLVSGVPTLAIAVDKLGSQQYDKARDELQTKNADGKLYTYFRSAGLQGTIADARKQVEKLGATGVWDAAALKEAFTKGSTGGQAIRMGMLSMINSGYPYPDVMWQAMSRFFDGGGGLDKPQADALMAAINRTMKDNAYNYAQQIETQAEVLDKIPGGYGDQLRNLEPELKPFVDYVRGQATTGEVPGRPANIPQDNWNTAVQRLRQHPSAADKFDKQFGLPAGTAKRILGQGGSTGSQSSTFPTSQ